MEKQNWYAILESLEEIILGRLEKYKKNKKEGYKDYSALLHHLKNEGLKRSDEWVVDMAICIRRILKEEHNEDIENHIEEEEDVSQSDLFLEEDLNDEDPMTAMDYSKGLIEQMLSEIKKMLCEEMEDQHTMHNEIVVSIGYFNSTLKQSITTAEDLFIVINELTAEEMTGYLELIYEQDVYLATQIDNLLLENV